jgi:hypothetical protein
VGLVATGGVVGAAHGGMETYVSNRCGSGGDGEASAKGNDQAARMASYDRLLTVVRVDDPIHGQMDTAFPKQPAVAAIKRRVLRRACA